MTDDDWAWWSMRKEKWRKGGSGAVSRLGDWPRRWTEWGGTVKWPGALQQGREVDSYQEHQWAKEAEEVRREIIVFFVVVSTKDWFNFMLLKINGFLESQREKSGRECWPLYTKPPCLLSFAKLTKKVDRVRRNSEVAGGPSTRTGGLLPGASVSQGGGGSQTGNNCFFCWPLYTKPPGLLSFAKLNSTLKNCWIS